MSIAIIGSGYIGQTLGNYYYDNNFKVTFYDISEDVLKKLNNSGYKINKNFKDIILNNRYIFITVPTPTINKKIDLKAFKETIDKLYELKDSLSDKIFIIKSTIIPGTTEKYTYKLKDKKGNFGILYSPEFITEIAKTWDENSEEITFGKEDRVVIGESENKKWGDIFVKEMVLNKNIPILRTNYKEAEMIKYVSNVMLATKISFWNEIYLLSEKIGINFEDLAKGVSLDKRIGKYGTVTGKAFGGKCLPKDLAAFISWSDKKSDLNVIKSVNKVNNFMKENFGVRE